MTLEEVANELGLTIGDVARAEQRALAKLRAGLGVDPAPPRQGRKAPTDRPISVASAKTLAHVSHLARAKSALTAERDTDIRAAFADGADRSALARQHGLTRGRINQILGGRRS